ncbi:MAG: hypothetical protein HZC45_07985 [Deltaproteobacteria bacterium]|nr:hypothetical protein [Deltaproteobacteria bacterium]
MPANLFHKNSTIDKYDAYGLFIVDYAFALLRVVVILGGFLWLLFHPFPQPIRGSLTYLFAAFVVYSVFLLLTVFIWHDKVEKIYLAALAIDMGFIGLFIKLSGGFQSNIFVAFYLLTALHSFYYGLIKGLTFAFLTSLVYIITIFNDWETVLWTDMVIRTATIFLIAGFLGFLSERTRHDREEILKMNMELTTLTSNLNSTYNNLQEVKRQVEQSEKLAAIGRLVAELAHEINNPLDGIKNCLNVLTIEKDDTELRERYFKLMQESVRDIEQSVIDLLEYAKQHDFKLEMVNVNDVVKRTILMGEYKFNKYGIKVKRLLEEDLPDIHGDPHHLQQVFFNIIFNAIDAMPNGGSLMIETRREDGFVGVEITDTGTGIPKKDIEKIFMPFYTTKKLGEGTGLGLPISAGIVRRHNGQMDVYSYLNIGTTFRIILPITQSASRSWVSGYRNLL